MAQYGHATCDGGVGAPVGLTVFKTAEGSLGAVPGGFDSHTPLPDTRLVGLRIVINTMVLQILQNHGINDNQASQPQCRNGLQPGSSVHADDRRADRTSMRCLAHLGKREPFTRVEIDSPWHPAR